MNQSELSCKDSLNHGSQWVFKHQFGKTDVNICFACSILCLEERQQLMVRKEAYLSTLLDVLQRNPHIIISLVEKDEQVSMHTAMVFLNLCCGVSGRVTTSSGECLLLFLIHIEKEEVRLAVAQKLTVEIEEELNYLQSLPRFHLLGRLLQVFPEISYLLLSHRPQVFHNLASAMSDSSEEVRSAIAYVFLQVYSSDSGTNEGTLGVINSLIAKGILCTLKKGQTKDAMKNSLALLKIFIHKDTKRIHSLFENPSGDVSFACVTKKILISTECAFQVAIVHCVCQILSFSPSAESHAQKLIDENVPELLFEVVSGKNELLTETVLCCLLLFSNHPAFYEKCQVIYGLTTILEVATHLLKIRNLRLLCVALNLLTSLVSSDQYILAASIQSSCLQQALHLVENSYKIPIPQVLFTISKFFSSLLKKETGSLPLPLSQLHNILQLCLRSMQRFFLTQQSASSSCQNNCKKHSDAMPLEENILICGLNIIYYFIRMTKQQSTDLVTEEVFTCPRIENVDNSSKSTKKINFQPIFETCIIAIEKIFLPYCLFLGSDSDFGKISWHHLIEVLSAIYEEPFDDALLIKFSHSLIKVRFINHVWDIKVDEIILPTSIETASSKDVCNNCLKWFFYFLLKKERTPNEYLSVLENGLKNLNCTINACATILSQKCGTQDHITDSFHLYISQIVFLCLCYFSYLNDAPIVKTKTLIPHLIYFITCNSNSIASSKIVMKHIIFLLAVCSHDNINQFQNGLMEVSGLVWDLLAKFSTFVEVYTHHKLLLWWSFQNVQFNLFSSFVLQTWLEFSLHLTNTTTIILALRAIIHLLCNNENTQETFVRLFDKKYEVVFSFLKKAFELEVNKSDDGVANERFDQLLLCLVQHIHACLTKILIMKDCREEITGNKFLSVGLECLLWCYEKLHKVNLGIHVKLIFQVLNYCSNSDFGDKANLKSCLKYLQFIVKDSVDNSKAWYVVTGNTNIAPFLIKCLALKGEIETEALCLLEGILEHQINACLKSTTKVKILLFQLLKWLNNPKTQMTAFRVLDCLLRAEFTDIFLSIHSHESDIFTSQKPLSTNELRLLAIYLQNALVVGNPGIEDIALSSYMKLLSYISRTDPILEKHIMLQPWLRILLESKLETCHNCLELFEKCYGFYKENITLREVMDQFAEKISQMVHQDDMESSIKKLITGIYKRHISNKTKANLKTILNTKSKSMTDQNTAEKDVVSEVESLVMNYRSNTTETI